MSRRARVVAALVTAVVHVAVLAPLAEGHSVIVGPVWGGCLRMMSSSSSFQTRIALSVERGAL